MDLLLHLALGACLLLGGLSLPACLYLALLSLVSVVPRRQPSGSRSRFAIVVPAHNEAQQIGATVASLKALDYPSAQFDIVVVADNCSDGTAACARAAGATVLERQDAQLRGKGYALEHAFAHLLQLDRHDAAVVVDADTLVSQNLLRAFAGRLEQGALAVQGHYGVSNPQASWRTRLMTVALAMFHRLRSLGRERLGVSAGLRGNGMCFTLQLLRQHPHKAFGLVEDVEYGIAIGRGGVRIAYADDARVYGEMVSNAAGSQTQRQRWEGGRSQLVRQVLPGLVGEALRRGDAMLLDLACDLAVPPLATLGLSVVVQLGLVAALWGLSAGGTLVWVATCLAAANALGLVAYVGRGAVLSELGLGALTALMWAPIYVVWKFVLMLRPGRKNQAWVRTQRETEKSPPR